MFARSTASPVASPPISAARARRAPRALALAAAMGLAACTSASAPPAAPPPASPPPVAVQHPGAGAPPASTPVASGPGAALPAEGLAPVVARVRPAIVTILVRKPVHMRGMEGAPPWMFRFGPGGPGGPGGMSPRDPDGGFLPEEQGEGSGVIVTSDGTILTNRHVVDGADQVEVSLTDGRKLTGKVVGVDPPTDIAVVKVTASGLPTVSIGDSSALQVGDFTLAIGSPFGLGQSVTFGIVSAIGRSGIGVADYEDFIQTDAAINPGNSGGALLDTQGRLVGINTAIIAHGAAGNQGIGLAVPVNLAVSVMRQLVAHGRVVRGFLGVSIQDVTPELAAGLGLERPGGALVGEVSPGSPAAKAGLRRGDVVVALEDQPVADGHALRVRIADRQPGTTVHLRVVRDRQARDVAVALAELRDQGERASAAAPGEGGARGYGLRLSDLDPATAGQLGIPAGTAGVAIAGVEPNSPAAERGLRAGDVIQEIDGRPVTGARAAADALHAPGGAPRLLLVLRDGHTFFVALARR